MKLTEIQTKAKELGIRSKDVRKSELIRKIQTEEGNFPCYQMHGDSCRRLDCCWRKDCLV